MVLLTSSNSFQRIEKEALQETAGLFLLSCSTFLSLVLTIDGTGRPAFNGKFVTKPDKMQGYSIKIEHGKRLRGNGSGLFSLTQKSIWHISRRLEKLTENLRIDVVKPGFDSGQKAFSTLF
ncbi:hypothetical protein [Bartonella apis]|uniref:hypothetical protein n=1 Tax=Bartonella apis TaxID=1686310 RepID=UPI0026EA11AE|nr:hypothetical protein [Bartonella apis]